MIERIKLLRLRIDALGQLLKQNLNSAELTKAHNELMLAKAWYGKLLGILGNDTPYKNEGKRKTADDIEPTADRATESKGFIYEGQVQLIDLIRQDIGSIVKLHKQLVHDIMVELAHVPYLKVTCNNAYTSLCTSRFWLGFELERIYTENKQNEAIAKEREAHPKTTEQYPITVEDSFKEGDVFEEVGKFPNIKKIKKNMEDDPNISQKKVVVDHSKKEVPTKTIAKPKVKPKKKK